MKAKVQPNGGHKYYAYALLYPDDVDDILIVHHDSLLAVSLRDLCKIDKYFKMKPGSIGDPDFYFGAKV
jgi:hypothetical protein